MDRWGACCCLLLVCVGGTTCAAPSVPPEVSRQRQAVLKRLCMDAGSELYSTLYLLADEDQAKWKKGEAGILRRIEIKRSHIAFFYMDIVLAYRLFRDRLSERGRGTIRAYIEEHTSPGSFKYGCRFVHANDNWPFNAVSNMILGGECIGRDDLVLEGISRLEHFLMTTRQLGASSEYNSPTYNALSLHAVEAVADLAQSLRARVTARVVAERLWLETATRYHAPSRQLAAPHSRAYFEDSLGVRSAMFYTLYPLLPDPPSLEAEGFPAAKRHVQTCPENSLIRRFFEPYHAAVCLRKPFPYHVRARKFRPYRQEGRDTWPGGFFDTVTYMTATYAVGSAQRVFCGGHSTTPFQVHWVDTSDGGRFNTLFTRYRVDNAFPNTGAKLDHQFPENGYIHPVQHRNTTVVLYRPKLDWKRREKDVVGARELCASVLIPYADRLDQVCVGSHKRPVSTFPCELRKPEALLLQDGDCYLAVHPLAVTDLGRRAAMRLERRGPFVVLSLLNLEASEPRELAPDVLADVRNGFVVEVGDAAEYGDFRRFCRAVGDARVDDSVRDGVRTVRYRRSGRRVELSQRTATHQFSSRRFDRREYTGPMLDGPHTTATLGGRIELGDATLLSTPGEPKFLTVEPTTGTYSVLYPFRWPFPLHLKTPRGALECEGFRLGKIVYQPGLTASRLVIDCHRAPRPLRVTKAPDELTVILNDQDVSSKVKRLPDGRLEIALPGNREQGGMHARIDVEVDADSVVLGDAGKGHLRATVRNVGEGAAEQVVTVPFISGFVRHYGCGTRRIAQLAPGASEPVSWGLTGVPGARSAELRFAAGADNAPVMIKRRTREAQANH